MLFDLHLVISPPLTNTRTIIIPKLELETFHFGGSNRYASLLFKAVETIHVSTGSKHRSPLLIGNSGKPNGGITTGTR